jgi:Cu+-exporting ATPase
LKKKDDVVKAVIPIRGMHCVNCAQTVEEALKSLEAVKSASVNSATEKARVEYDPNIISIPNMRHVVRQAQQQ